MAPFRFLLHAVDDGSVRFLQSYFHLLPVCLWQLSEIVEILSELVLMKIIRLQITTVAHNKGKIPPKEGNGVLHVFIAVSIHYLTHPFNL